MEPNHPIQILLATYNGEKYLSEQLDSLLAQSMQDFEILIRDDGSSDNTLPILISYQERFPKKIRLLPSHSRLGVIGNFNALLEASTADYILFSDQDDIWLKDKVKLTYDALKRGELMHGNSSPLLVHTDLTIVDSIKTPFSESFWKFSNINPFLGRTLNRLLVQNTVTGCTMGINRALANLSKPFPSEARMHDWWLALVASLTGHIISLNETPILYRQHDNNTLGAKAPSLIRKLKLGLCFLTMPSYSAQETEERRKQAKVLLERYNGILKADDSKVLHIFTHASKMTRWERKKAFLKYKFFKSGFAKNLAYFFQDSPF